MDRAEYDGEELLSRTGPCAGTIVCFIELAGAIDSLNTAVACTRRAA